LPDLPPRPDRPGPAAPGPIELAPGDLVPGLEHGGLAATIGWHWQIAHGALRVDACGAPLATPALALLVAGDWLPAGLIPHWADAHRLQALVPTRLLAAPRPTADEAGGLLPQVLAQLWQRGTQLAALRAGPVPERVRHLLLMLAEADAGRAPTSAQTLLLPNVRHIADLLGTTPESVSRTMTALRRLDLLLERQGNHTRFDARQLSVGDLPRGLTRSDQAAPPLAVAPRASATRLPLA